MPPTTKMKIGLRTVIGLFILLSSAVMWFVSSMAETEELELSTSTQDTLHEIVVDGTENSPEVLQVIRSRFMVNQGNLTTLGKTRFELLKTFTFPSLTKQTSQNFIWLILTDPSLEDELKLPLLELVRPHSNVIVLATERGRPSHSRLFDESKCKLDDLDCFGQVWTDNHDLFASTIERVANKSPGGDMIFLDTWLDADDAVYLDFIRDVQLSAKVELNQHKRRQIVFCPLIIDNWHYLPSLINKTDSDGLMKGKKARVSSIGSFGKLEEKNSNFCLTPGLTTGFGSEIRPRDSGAWNINEHHTPVYREHLFCNGTSTHVDNKTAATTSIESGVLSECLIQLRQATLPVAARSRTPTSTGFHQMITEYDSELKKEVDLAEQAHLWEQLESDFGLSKKEIAKARAFIQTNFESALAENIDGAPGAKATVRMKELLNATTRH